MDFSGAKSDKHTWMARGLFDGVALVLNECRPVSRAELENTLSAVAMPCVAALDFPFSVPRSFAERWLPSARAMPELWEAVAGLELGDFVRLRDEFVALYGEPKRLCDTYYPESYSCLHKANPNMVPMTFYGMRMLHRLWRLGCDVPPLPARNAGRPLDSTGSPQVLLEAMPGAALKALGLPYKGYKNGANAASLRRRILDGLSPSSSIAVRGLDRFESLCLATHDCLDAVVAAVVAALWAKSPRLFRLPTQEELRAQNGRALIEGWLYAPAFQKGPPE